MHTLDHGHYEFNVCIYSPSRPVPLAQAADGLAAKTSEKAGKTVPYDEYEPCPVSLLRFWIQLRLRCVGRAAVVYR